MITLRAYLEYLDFDYKINDDNTISLIDRLGANLANIESEKFNINDNLPLLLSDRLLTYENDYIFEGIINILRGKCDYKGEIYPYDIYIIKAMKKYPNEFNKEFIDFVTDIVNINIDINELMGN